ncbi:MAG: hypothetical protein JNL32_15100, partial [Candidatus Kapabacteria bacterium]|nr:hypothetical protein [Candidatus Kapabacteria bacterium]
MTYGTPPQTTSTTTSFTVRQQKPVPCLYKEICNPQNNYQLGSVFRYRLRIQNIGGAPLTGVTLTDVLNPNLQYIGNPMTYISSSYATPCGGGGSGSGPWNGVTVNPPGPLSNTVTFNLPSIGSQVCDIKASPSCGDKGTDGLLFYFIEFDVKVRETSALGNIPNVFSLSGGNISATESSNTVYALVEGTPALSVAKSVRKSAATPYSTSAGVNSGSTIQYRLQSTIPAGTPYLHDIHMVDLLPKNDGPNDKFIASPCSTRGSQFDVTWGNNILTIPTGSPTAFAWWAPNGPTTSSGVYQMQSYLNFKGNSTFPDVFNNGQPTCASSTTSWFSNPATGMTTPGGLKNIGFHLGTGPRTGIQTIEFDAKVASNATNGQTACNTFVTGGWVQHLINSTTANFQRVVSGESNTACVIIADSNKCLNVNRDSTKVTVGGWVNGSCTNNVTATLTNPNATATTYTVIPPTGTTVTPSSVTIAGNATVQQTFTVTLLIPPPQNVCIRLSLAQNQPPCDSICFTTRACPVVPSCFTSVNLNNPPAICAGTNSSGQQQYSITMTGNNTNGAVTVFLASPGGTVLNATGTPSFTVAANGLFTRILTFTDTPALPNAPGVVTIFYTIVTSTGQTISCSSKVDLGICITPPPTCCQNFVKRFRNVDITRVQSPPVTGQVTGEIRLTANIVAGTAPIRKFTAAIVNAQFRNRSQFAFGPWTRTWGDMNAIANSSTGTITAGTAPPQNVMSTQLPITATPTTTPTSGPMPLDIAPPFTREAVWNGQQPQPCQDWMRRNGSGVDDGVNLTLNMRFPLPPATPVWQMYQQLSFSVKFTFTDCNCNTCDTTLHFVTTWRRDALINPVPFPSSIISDASNKGKGGNS